MKQVFSAGTIVIFLVAAAAGAAGFGSTGLSSSDLAEVFCGTAPPAFLSAPVVLPPHQEAMTVDVSIAGFAFSPQNLTINVGDTVRWTNFDGTNHTATSNTGVWDTGNFASGSRTFTFNNAGSFPYHCSRHPSMMGSITVQVPSPPTISAVPVMRTAGAGVSSSTIANADDPVDPLNTLTVTVNGGASATQNGVTVDNISVNGAGVVTANVVAAVGAADAAFTLTVTNSSALSATSTLPVIVRSPCPGSGTWNEQARPTPSDNAANDRFGYSVAISGDTAIVGAIWDDTAGGANAGSAYIFTRSGSVWTQQQKLTASDGAANDEFGTTVAISGDTTVIGTYFDNGEIGAAYVFTRSGTVWTQQQKLTASDGAGLDAFGNSVAISGDTIIVGAVFNDTPGGTDAGSAYIFTRSGTVWTQQQNLTASDGLANDNFGKSVAISGDIAIVGASFDDTTASNAGSAYIFTRSGSVWTQQQKLTAFDGAADDQFGGSVSISGETAIAGAYGDDTAAGLNTGSAYVFTRSGSAWTLQQKLIASDSAAGDALGSVAISGDTAILGAFTHDVSPGDNAGSVYIFIRSGNVWVQQQELTASDTGAGDLFGLSVAIGGDTVIVGAYSNDTAAGMDAGSSYVFTKTCPGPTSIISGTVTYGNASSPPKYISNVTVIGTGSPTVATTTAAPGGTAGQYSLSGFGGSSYTVSLAKTTGQNGVTSNDAARIAQHVAGSNLFTNDIQRVTADVSNNNVVSSFDAAQIATFVATGSSPGIAGQWRFFLPPGPTFPVGASPTTRTYPSVTADHTNEDYVGLLFGDVTGNWTPSGARPVGSGRSAASSGPVRAVAVGLNNLTAPLDKGIVVPVRVQGLANKEVISYEFDLRYDPSVILPIIHPVDVVGTASRGLSIVTNAIKPGLLRVVAYGAMPINEDGVLLDLRFTAVGRAGSVSPLKWERIMFNEGDPMTTASDGQIELAYAVSD